MATLGALTHVLHVLITRQRDHVLPLRGAATATGHVGFVDDNAVGHSSGEKSRTVGVARPARVIVKSDVGEAVAEDAEKER